MLTSDIDRYTNIVTYTYDNAGRKSTEALTTSGPTYTTTTNCDALGQLTGCTYPDGTSVGRSYTNRGELYQLTHATTTIDTRTYDNGGSMTGSTYNNGVSESRTYNADNTLASISYTGAAIGNLTYGWDDNKNKTSEAIAGTMSDFGFTIPSSGYDDEDRLVTYNRTDGNLDQSWSLSEVGDWDSITTEGVAQNRTYGPTHELLTGGGGTVNTDVKGNITLIPSNLRTTATSLALNWDMDNRLSTADVGNNSSIDLTYKFDALGRRVYRDDGTTATVFVQSGQQTIADYTAGTAASSPTYRYVYASYIDEPVLRFKPTGSESLYFHRNQQYSITALTNGSGSIVERYAYSAYDVPTITSASAVLRMASQYDNRYMYTGREWDEAIDIYHYRARMYDPVLGRFCSRDPIGYLGGLSLYRYVSNGPLAKADPMGLDWIFIDPIIGGSPWGGCGPFGNEFGDPTPVPPVLDDWWQHFYNGGGVDFDLNDHSELYDLLTNSPVTQELINSSMDLAMAAMMGGGCRNGSGSFSKTFDRIRGNYGAPVFDHPIETGAGGICEVLNFGANTLWPLGNSWVTPSVSCTWSSTCTTDIGHMNCRDYRQRKSCYTLNCTVTLTYDDSFSDTADWFNRIDGFQELPGGTPYKIKGTIKKSKAKSDCKTAIEWIDQGLPPNVG